MFQTRLQRGGIDHEQQVLGIDAHAANCEACQVQRVVALLKDRAIVAHARKWRRLSARDSCVDPRGRSANGVLRVGHAGSDCEQRCDHDTRTIGAIFFMRGIMTRKPGPDKPLILMQYDSDDERGSTLVSATLGAEIAARVGPRSESPLSILAYDGDALVGGLNGATHWGWCYIRHFWVEQSFRRVGASDAGCWRMPSCKPARDSA